MERTLDKLVVALCADYKRREAEIGASSVTHRTEMEYRYFNFKIFDAAAEIVGEKSAYAYIEEIGEHRGYADSEFIEDISERTYKMRKLQVKENIARRLHLID